MKDQPLLFDNQIETAFQKYHADNPQVYQYFKRFAFEKINNGAKHIGANAVVERIRWESPVIATGEFKINNNFAPYYARLFMKDFPKHDGIFATRKSKADKEDL